MKKILLIPLDTRPCNYTYQPMMTKGTDLEILLPPLDIMPYKKGIGDPDALFDWMEANADGCDGAIISVDTLVYSSILASRLHMFDLETSKKRLLRLRDFKAKHPDMLMFGFSLIMRNPKYSSGDEEPDYYEYWGREIHRWGYIGHRKELGIATEEEEAEYQDILVRLPQEYLNDYIGRREKNIVINKMAIDLTAEGLFDYFMIPQDDSSPYGLTAKDQQIIRQHIRNTKTQLKCYMYPDADGVENSMIARMANKLAGKRPLIYVKYASASGDTLVPCYEDRMVSETIKYHILSAGGLIASSAAEADLILMINTPSANQLEHSIAEPLPARIEYDANRNQIEQIEYARYAIEVLNKPVSFADNAHGNGGDPELLALLRESGLMWKVAGYAGWNTSSNTLGTAIPMAMLYLLYGPRQAHTDFLALRYVEDVGYMANVRREVCQEELPQRGMDYFNIDGQRGEIASIIKARLQKFADENVSDAEHRVVIDDCWQPWARMFETGLFVHVE